MKIIKVGIIGFGNVGKKRFDALRKLKSSNISITFICENKKINIKDKKIKVYKNWKKAIKNKIDLLCVCTPTRISEKIVKKVIGRFHLMVEKPISKNLNFTKKITKISSVKRKILKTGYNLRFDEGLKYVKTLLQKKTLGKIYHCKITYANGTTLTNTNQVGSLFDMASHSVNLIEWFF